MDDRRRGIGRLIGAAIALLFLAGAVVGFLGASNDTTDDGGLSATSGGTTGEATAGDAGASESLAAPTTTIPGSAYANRQALASTDEAEMQARSAGSDAPPAAITAPSPAPAPTPGAAVPDQQKIVKNAVIRLEIKAKGFRQAFDSASRVAGAHGGFVVSSESSTESEADSHGVLVLRVPAASFDAVRADLTGLGEVKDEHLTGQDVGGQIVDLDARIRSLQAQEEALRALMAKARTIGETVEVQGHLTQVRQQIEQLAGEKARLEDAAALATIRVELFEPGAAAAKPPQPKDEPSTLRQAVTKAVDGAETVLAGTIIVLGWLLPISVLVAIVVLALRPFLRRRPALAEPALLAEDGL